MEVQRMMRHSVRTCHPNDSLNEAAQIMWEDTSGSVRWWTINSAGRFSDRS